MFIALWGHIKFPKNFNQVLTLLTGLARDFIGVHEVGVVQGTVLAVKNRLAALAVPRVGRFTIRGLATGGKVILLQWPLYFIIIMENP